jgi:hypothetical protein
LIIWNFLLEDLPNVWQNSGVSPLLKLRHSRFPPLADLHNSDFLSEYTTCTQLLLPGTR